MTHRPDRDQQKAKFVYFARGLHSNLIKIGCSWSPTQRAGSLEMEWGEPVRMLFTEPGSFQKERGYHLRFLDHKADRGAEWFHEGGTLHAFLKRKGHAGTPVVYKKQLIEKVVELPGAAVLAFPELAGKAEPIEPRMVGYARVSTEDQNLDMQLTMLRQAGVRDEDLFMDKLSAVSAKRPYFNLMLKHLYPGDTLCIYAMNRLSRDVRMLYGILDELRDLGVTVKSLTQPDMDTTTAHGRMMLTITAAVDQNERERTIDRTKDGMKECKRKGMYLGRPRKVFDEDIEEMRRLRKAGKSAKFIAKKYNVTEGTVYNYTREGGSDERAA